MPETAEDVDVLHRAVRGQKEHIGAEILSAGTYENVLIVAVAPGDGVLRVVAEAEGLAVCLAVEEAVLALCDTDGGAVPGEGGPRAPVPGALRPARGAFGAAPPPPRQSGAAPAPAPGEAEVGNLGRPQAQGGESVGGFPVHIGARHRPSG